MTLAVGIDAGGTKLAAGLVDLDTGVVLRRDQVPSLASRGGGAVLADCHALAERLGAGKDVPIGLGVPELVDLAGRITSNANWDWRGLDVAASFVGLAPATIVADVRAAALAEARFGAGRSLAAFVYLTVGTGISHTLVLDGEPWAGVHGCALSLGAPLVEGVAAGPALARLAGVDAAPTALSDPRHDAVVERAAAALGGEVARLVNALDPEAIVVGGGLGLHDGYRRRWVAAMRPLVFADASRCIEVRVAALGADAGIVGAALGAGTHAIPTISRRRHAT